MFSGWVVAGLAADGLEAASWGVVRFLITDIQSLKFLSAERSCARYEQTSSLTLYSLFVDYRKLVRSLVWLIEA